eukprot:tig00020965_g16864.t1
MTAGELLGLSRRLQQASEHVAERFARAAAREAAGAAARPPPPPATFDCGVCLEARPLAARRAVVPCVHVHVFCLSCLTSVRSRGDPCPTCRGEIRDVSPVHDGL